MKHHTTYKRLEKDTEFRARILALYTISGTAQVQLALSSGQYLDDYVWRLCQRQRKIVEDVA